MSRLLVLLMILGLLVAACGPEATPAPTTEPTEAPTEEAVEEATDEATEAATEATEEAEEAPAASVDVSELEVTIGAKAGASNIKLRDIPGSKGEVLTTISINAELDVFGQTENSAYALVRTADGVAGWVPLQSINLAEIFAELPVINPDDL